jgi:hypothetical protein
MMRKPLTTASLGFAFGVLAIAAVATAETVRTETTTTYTGTVSEINPATSTIILRSEPTAAPVTYTYSKETSFVDASGNVVSYEAIRNSPVRVEYTSDGGRTVVRRVIQTGPAVMVPAPTAPGAPGTIIKEKTIRTETDD